MSLGAPTRSPGAPSVEPSVDPLTGEVEGYPEEFPPRLRAISRDQDPAYPGQDGEKVGQCCECGSLFTLDKDTMVCRAFVPDGASRCTSVVCEECMTECPMDLCPCEHYVQGGRVCVEPTGRSRCSPGSSPVTAAAGGRTHGPSEPSSATGASPTAESALVAAVGVLTRMNDGLTVLKDEVLAHRSGSGAAVMSVRCSR